MKEAEIRAVDAARDLLRDVPGLQVESVEYERKIGRDNAVDGLVDFAHGGGAYTIVVEARSNGAPRFVRAGAHRLESCVSRLRRSGEPNGGRRFIPMIVSPYLSRELARHLPGS